MQIASPLLRTKITAFTMVELLVTVTIIFLLAALLAGTWDKILQASGTAKSAGNLKNLCAVGLVYAADNEMQLPGKSGLQWDLDILHQMNPLADPVAPAGSSGRIAAEGAAKVFASPLDKLPLFSPTDIRRSYVMNAFLLNLWGAHPAFPGAPADTPVRVHQISTPSKVWVLGDGFRPWGSGLGVAWGHIGGTPWSGGGRPDWVQVAFLDGHVERINIGAMTYGLFWQRYSNPQTAGNY